MAPIHLLAAGRIYKYCTVHCTVPRGSFFQRFLRLCVWRTEDRRENVLTVKTSFYGFDNERETKRREMTDDGEEIF
jgi:hypothetical protein